MMNSGDKFHSEIIIIKRGAEEEESHHGGAWKIAFADFMTAMMALFLVLWLINAANEETKRAVASYFNPVKLVDRNRSSKGVDEQRGGPTRESSEGALPTESDTTQSPTSTQQQKDRITQEEADKATIMTEEKFFMNPLASLETIAADEIRQLSTKVLPQEIGQDSQTDGFADPFAPDFWKQSIQKQSDRRAEDPRSDSQDSKVGRKADEDLPATQSGLRKPITTLSETVQSEIQAILQELPGLPADMELSIEVKPTDKGVLISVTDTLKSPMFDVGSSVPKGAIVLAVAAIARALEHQKGDIHIFGHTDGRPFLKKIDSNWKLSTDRANATYYMLLHGGLSENRVAEISGYADRRLRNSKNPLADENRRIEILLESQ